MANRVHVKVPVNGNFIRNEVVGRHGSFGALKGKTSYHWEYIYKCSIRNEMPLEMCYEVAVIIGHKPECFCDFDEYFRRIKELYGWNERFED